MLDADLEAKETSATNERAIDVPKSFEASTAPIFLDAEASVLLSDQKEEIKKLEFKNLEQEKEKEEEEGEEKKQKVEAKSESKEKEELAKSVKESGEKVPESS